MIVQGTTCRDQKSFRPFGIATDVAAILRMIAGALVLSAAAANIAKAQETPRLLGYELNEIHRWCGDRFIYAKEDDEQVLIDVDTRTRIKLRRDPQNQDLLAYAELIACSPDGNWAIARTGGVGDTSFCHPSAKVELPDIQLWDTVNPKRYDIGKGYFGFAWSADGTMLLHRLLPYCGLERDARAFLQLPPEARGFQAIAIRDMLRGILKSDSGWKDDGPIGATSWIGSDRFVVQLPEVAAQSLESDITENGAIVLVHQSQGTATGIEQLNPGEFRSSWTLNISQIPPPASDVILLSAQCDTLIPLTEYLNDGTRITHDGMTCAEKYPAEDLGVATDFKFDQARYCKGLKVGDVQEFCNPERNPPTWTRYRHGPRVLLVRNILGMDVYSDLFLMENDAGTYLK
jgi:hypothetical protein